MPDMIARRIAMVGNSPMAIPASSFVGLFAAAYLNASPAGAVACMFGGPALLIAGSALWGQLAAPGGNQHATTDDELRRLLRLITTSIDEQRGLREWDHLARRHYGDQLDRIRRALQELRTLRLEESQRDLYRALVELEARTQTRIDTAEDEEGKRLDRGNRAALAIPPQERAGRTAARLIEAYLSDSTATRSNVPNGADKARKRRSSEQVRLRRASASYADRLFGVDDPFADFKEQLKQQQREQSAARIALLPDRLETIRRLDELAATLHDADNLCLGIFVSPSYQLEGASEIELRLSRQYESAEGRLKAVSEALAEAVYRALLNLRGALGYFRQAAGREGQDYETARARAQDFQRYREEFKRLEVEVRQLLLGS